jgi:hypothetical protein
MGPPPELTDRERIESIEQALRACNQRVTRAAVARQFRYETGRKLEEEGAS